MKNFFAFFRRLQWKLASSYAIVTAGTVIVLAALLAGYVILIESQVGTRTYDSFYWSKTGFQDNIPYLVDDRAALQAWLERVQAEGFSSVDFRSYTVRETLDYANTLIYGTQPIYVLDPGLNLLAAAPLKDSAEIDKPFNINGVGLATIVDAALVGDKNYYAQAMRQLDGSYLVAFPLRRSDADPVVAIAIYAVKPLEFATPTNLEIYQTFFIVTALVMFAIAPPVGAVFGWLVSRGLRKRLGDLSAASQAWSKGDFSVTPRDPSGDEIGALTRNLNSMAEQLQNLLGTRDELARVEERNRLARDLHDTVKQQLYAERMQLFATKNLLEADPEAAAGHIESALQLNRESQQDIKHIIDELRPAELEGKGLVQAIAEYVMRWREHTAIQVNLTVSGERSLPLEVEQVFYRVLQEALSNIARHSNATVVDLALTFTSEAVTLEVKDNGHGFDLEAVPENSLGITGMKQRLEEIGGSLSIDSTPEVGTSVIAEVQLTDNSTQ